MSDPHPPEDDDEIEGCQAVEDLPPEEEDDDETSGLRAIFPAGADTPAEEIAETIAALEYLEAVDA